MVVGKGAREHALATRLLQSPTVTEVILNPGGAGTEQGLEPGLSNEPGDPLEVAKRLQPDLVVIGPEVPLCDGLVDQLKDAGVLAYGPSRAAAQLEGSKSFMKRFADQYEIATGGYRVVTEQAQLAEALAQFDSPPVVKADGLCAGKGVVVAESHEEASQAAEEMLSGRAFGAAGQTLVLEERLVGSEVSVHAICDGKRAWILPCVQDHKRLSEGDRGPNTGGMGTYGPVALPDEGLGEHIRSQIVEKVLAGMAKRGTPFVGTLFANLMLVPGREPLLLEINTRFGDPETQILMNIVPGDLCEVLLGAAKGELPETASDYETTGDCAMCVVLAAPGYPVSPETGQPIEGLQKAAQVEGVRVYHAGTVRQGENCLTAGGRVLGVTAVAGDLRTAQQRAYAAVDLIDFEGKQYRRDIGKEALGGAL